MKKLSVFILSLIFLSCSKNNDTAPAAGSSIDSPQYGTPFTSVPSGADAVIYQVNMRAFSTAGNFQGVTARLDSIKNLGVNVVYLMPIYPVGTLNSVNSPYAVKDYKAVGSEFGTLDDLRTLVNEAHEKNMAVILDFVANHTSWDHPWIAANKSWYQQDTSGNIIQPPGTNYTDVAQLNFNNDTMRTAMIEAMRYWVFAANIDGYRFDYADFIPFDFWKQALTSLKSISGRQLLFLAEGTRSDHFRAGFDFTFGFEFFNKLKELYADGESATQINDVNSTEYTNAYTESQVVRYTSNHDVNLIEGTPQELFNGTNGAMAAFVVAAYMKGVPMIYNGQEIGYAARIDYFNRTPINWGANPAITAEYYKVLAFRNSSSAIRNGQLFSYSSDDVVAFTKQQDNEKVLVMVNLRNKAVDYTLPAALANTTWTDALNSGNAALTSKVTLQPYAYTVLKNQ